MMLVGIVHMYMVLVGIVHMFLYGDDAPRMVLYSMYTKYGLELFCSTQP